MRRNNYHNKIPPFTPDPDRLTEEQEDEIAENIYDWWISGKSYKQWYTEKFQQLNLGLK